MSRTDKSSEEERENDAAIGRGARVVVAAVFEKFKVPIFLFLALGWSGREVARSYFPPQTQGVAGLEEQLQQVNEKLDRMKPVVDKMASTLIVVQVTNKAIINSLSPDQRAAAKASIESSLADLRNFKELQP